MGNQLGPLNLEAKLSIMQRLVDYFQGFGWIESKAFDPGNYDGFLILKTVIPYQKSHRK